MSNYSKSSFLINSPKRRAHRALFDNELPFRSKVEKSIKQYRRQPKHRKSGEMYV